HRLCDSRLARGLFMHKPFVLSGPMARHHEDHNLEKPLIELAPAPEHIAEMVGVVRDFRISEPDSERAADNPVTHTADFIVYTLLVQCHVFWRYVGYSCHRNLL